MILPLLEMLDDFAAGNFETKQILFNAPVITAGI